MGRSENFPRGKLTPRSGSGFGLGLALELGLGAIFLAGNFPTTIKWLVAKRLHIQIKQTRILITIVTITTLQLYHSIFIILVYLISKMVRDIENLSIVSLFRHFQAYSGAFSNIQPCSGILRDITTYWGIIEPYWAIFRTLNPRHLQKPVD